AIRRNGAKAEMVDEVRKLAMQYGIATPFTSQLIVEENLRLGGGRVGALAPRSGGPSGPSTGGPGAPGTPEPGGPPTPGPSGAWGPLPRTGAEAIAGSDLSSSDASYLGAARRGDAPPRTGRPPETSLRRAAGRTFLLVGDTWVEQGLPA